MNAVVNARVGVTEPDDAGEGVARDRGASPALRIAHQAHLPVAEKYLRALTRRSARPSPATDLRHRPHIRAMPCPVPVENIDVATSAAQKVSMLKAR